LQQFVGARADAFATHGRHFGWMAPGAVAALAVAKGISALDRNPLIHRNTLECL